MSEAPKYSEGWVDKQIREAQERGEFDNLPGFGKPLHVRDAGDPDWFAKALLEREQIRGVLPTPIALRKERRELPETIDEFADEDQVRAVLADFNNRIRDALLRGDGERVVVGGVNVEEYVEAWRRRRDPGNPRDPRPNAQ